MCLTLLDKKYNKKLIIFYVFINQFNLASTRRKEYFCFFTSPYILKFLSALKRGNFIFNFQLIPGQYISPFLLFSTFPAFINRIGFVFLSNSILYGAGLEKIQLVSRPSRYIYVQFRKLKRLLGNRRQPILAVFVINTIYGILLHTEALHLKVGGNLICLLK